MIQLSKETTTFEIRGNSKKQTVTTKKTIINLDEIDIIQNALILILKELGYEEE